MRFLDFQPDPKKIGFESKFVCSPDDGNFNGIYRAFQIAARHATARRNRRVSFATVQARPSLNLCEFVEISKQTLAYLLKRQAQGFQPGRLSQTKSRSAMQRNGR